MSLDVTEQGNASQDPVVRISCLCWCGRHTQTHGCDVRQVCAMRLLVHRTHVHVWVLDKGTQVDCKQVEHRQLTEQHLVGRLGQLAPSSVPASPIQEEAVHIDPLRGWVCHIVLQHLSDFIVKDNTVQSPPLVGVGHFLPHGRQESLRVEETCHPEDVGTSSEEPLGELSVPVHQFCEPEAQSG